MSSRALDKLARDLELDLRAVDGDTRKAKGVNGKLQTEHDRRRASYEAVLLAFKEWCDLNGVSFLVEMRTFCLRRMNLPITLPPASNGPKADRPSRASWRRGQTGRGNVRVRRDVDGVEFDSIRAAAAAVDCCEPTLSKAIKSRKPVAGSTWSRAPQKEDVRA